MKSLKLGISLTLICLVFILLGVFSNGFTYKVNAGQSLEGNGTEVSPYLINNIDDLTIMEMNVNNGIDSSSYYKLINNIIIEPTNLTNDNEIIKLTQSPISEEKEDVYSIIGGKIVFSQTGNYYVSYLLNDGSAQVDCYVIVNNVSSPEWYYIWNNPIGTIEDPFTGHFDGNGKNINGIAIIYDELTDPTYLGFLGVISGAEIKNLAIEVNVIVSDDGINLLNPVEIGAIAGRAMNNSTIKNCKIDFDFSGSRILSSYMPTSDTNLVAEKIYYTRSGNPGSYVYTIVETPNVADVDSYYELIQTETNRYLGEVICGGVVGYGQGAIISQCAITERFHIVQEGNNIVNSYFGGAVGYLNGGRIDFVYIAPSETLIGKISEKSGELLALASADADILINNTKLSSSTVAFGGLIGYAKNMSLTAYNNIFSTLFYTVNEAKMIYGGVIGEVSSNTSEQPTNITYCKFLSIQNTFLTSLTAVGNSSESGYVASLTNQTFNTMPTLSFFTEETWEELKEWNFNTVWKNESIISYGGYFFPNLQCFSTYNIRLSSINVVEFGAGNSYKSGYIYLYFVDSLDNPIYEDAENNVFATESNFDAGDEVKIRAVFYSDTNQSDPLGLRDFKNYYNFTNWRFGESIIIGASFTGGESNTERNANGYYSTSSESSSTISFTASSTTEGIYGINIIGEPILVKISLLIDNEYDEETNFGSVNQVIGSNKTNNTEDFTINIDQYQGGISTILEAINEENEVYVFDKWVDKNNEENIADIKNLTFELDNTKASTLTKFYPTVVYSEEDEGLIAEIICYFSNNTSALTLHLTGNGSVTIDGGESITNQIYHENLINDRLTTFIATPEEGYRFVGWYSEDTLLSNETTFTTSINEDSIMEARFEILNVAESTGLALWSIILIIVGSILGAGIIVLIIFKIKKNSSKGYKNNYRY